jgi:hypothetical protein
MRDEGGASAGSGLIETRWTKYGHDRVYLKINDDENVGFIDLKTKMLTVSDPRFDAACREVFARWCPESSSPSTPAPPTPPAVPGSSELPKLIKAKRDSMCTVCGATVRKGDDLFWVPNTNVVVCPPCTAGEVAAGLDSGAAGGAASRIADGVARKHAERLLAAYPMLGEHLVANARPTANMHAWMRGADGERIVGRKLDIEAEDGRIVVLHDRRLATGGNIDHLVIGPRRICVIDAKHYRNARVGKSKGELTIDGKSAEYLIDGVRHQVAAVARVLDDRPRIADNVRGVLAFVGAKVGWNESIVHRGVFCSTVKEAVSFAAWRHLVVGGTPIKLEEADRREIAERLAAAFPPA